jgi:hypothetical protein
VIAEEHVVGHGFADEAGDLLVASVQLVPVGEVVGMVASLITAPGVLNLVDELA